MSHISTEYPDIKAYALHPGVIETNTSVASVSGRGASIPWDDKPELPAATILWLTNRNAEFLSGRYIQASWDLNEIIAIKDEIVKDNLLVTKLAGPRKHT